MKYKSIIATIIYSVTLLSSAWVAITNTTEKYFELVRPEFKGDVAFETTAFVEKYWRVAGNTGFNESVYRIVAKLVEEGYIEQIGKARATKYQLKRNFEQKLATLRQEVNDLKIY